MRAHAQTRDSINNEFCWKIKYVSSNLFTTTKKKQGIECLLQKNVFTLDEATKQLENNMTPPCRNA